MNKRILFFTLFLLTGCSSGTQIEELAITLSAGIDEVDDEVTITSEIFSAESEGGKEGGGKSSSYNIESVSGENLIEAISKQKYLNPKEVTFSHNKVLVFGENALQNGITEIVSGFPQTEYIRGSTYIVAARGEARDIIKSVSIENQSIAESIVQLINRQGIKTKAGEFFQEASSSNKSGSVLPLLEIVEAEGKSRLMISGAALLNRGRLTGYLDKKDLGLVALLQNQGQKLRVEVEYKNKPVELIVDRSHFKINCIVSNNKPKFIFNGVLSFNVNKVPFGKITSTRDITNLESLVREDLNKKFTVLMEKILVEYQSDTFGFDDYLYRYHPSYWKGNKDKWGSFLPEVGTEFRMDITIKNVGYHS